MVLSNSETLGKVCVVEVSDLSLLKKLLTETREKHLEGTERAMPVRKGSLIGYGKAIRFDFYLKQTESIAVARPDEMPFEWKSTALLFWTE